MKTYAAMVLGCKVNDYEATYIKNGLNKKYHEVSFDEIADIYVIFTCCVTNTAEAKTRKFIHRARKQNKNAYVVAIGCLAQVKKDNEVFDDIDLVIGSSMKDKVVSLIEEGVRNNLVKDLNNTPFEELYIKDYPGKSRAFLKIQDGCNQFCNYCIIPYSRGRERSANHNTIINIANDLSKNFNEIVLTGIHTGRYFDGEYHLYDLLKDLLEKTNIQTIRLSSIEINEISDEIIDLIKNSNGRIAHHLHIPVQSTSSKVLKTMNRPYTFEEYYDRVSYIRNEIPNISISTDLIVGFPGESDDDFACVLENLKKIKFSFIHCFPYSRKEGTVADRMDEHINPKIKKERAKIVSEIEKGITFEFNKSFLGKTVEVLIEETDDKYSYGYAKEYLYINVIGEYKVGEIIPVKIIEVTNDKIVGEYVSK